MQGDSSKHTTEDSVNSIGGVTGWYRFEVAPPALYYLKLPLRVTRLALSILSDSRL
jgi:hypothetical protein